MKKEVCIIIPALKKSAVIPDQLVKKLNGITLIQRAINTAQELSTNENIFVVTDSQEISLICQRNGVHFYRNPDLKFYSEDMLSELQFFISKRALEYENILILQSNTPLIEANEIRKAYGQYKDKNADILVTLKQENHRIWRDTENNMMDLLFNTQKEKIFLEAKSFQILKSEFWLTEKKIRKVEPYILKDNAVEINGYQDWWICEKLLRRKRIVFVVAGHTAIGMGHIYRALTLAQEIHEHEIIFLCTAESELAVKNITELDYPTFLQNGNLLENVLELQPDLVINDMLNTEKDYVLGLKKRNIKVVNFEDLSEAAKCTDLTFNELYDEPKFDSPNTHWGSSYIFMRNEFDGAKPHVWKEKVESLMLSFGGADPNDYTRKVLALILPICEKYGIKIYIVVGVGYLFLDALDEYLEQLDYQNVELIWATTAISEIMEKTQIAIGSNGRTVYEYAHMNIPSIILSHHERENSHLFANETNGFVHLGIYKEDETAQKIIFYLEKLITDTNLRLDLYQKTAQFDFVSNKIKVLGMILGLLPQ